MKRIAFVIAGIGAVTLGKVADWWGITYTDQLFWAVLVPVAVIIGFFVNHLCHR